MSPATIRAVMAELEAAGLLTHPHTSAGRVPTHQGMRYYLDSLIQIDPVQDHERHIIDEELTAAHPEVTDIMDRTAKVLASLSSHVGLVVTPVRHDLIFRHMQFVKLSQTRLLGIFVTREGETQNRVIEVPRELNYSELEKVNNYCNAAFVGLTLAEARRKAATELAAAQGAMRDIHAEAMQFSAQVLEQTEDAELMVRGESSILDHPEFAHAERAKAVLAALKEKERLVSVLDHAQQGDGVRVFVGSESGYDALQDCSVVVSTYQRAGKILGALGVIGPTRMAYGRVIPIVRCAADQLSEWFDEG